MWYHLDDNNITPLQLLGTLLHQTGYHKDRALARLGIDIEAETFQEHKKLELDHALWIITSDLGLGKKTYGYGLTQWKTFREDFNYLKLFRDIASTLKRERKLSLPSWEDVFSYVDKEVQWNTDRGGIFSFIFSFILGVSSQTYWCCRCRGLSCWCKVRHSRVCPSLSKTLPHGTGEGRTNPSWRALHMSF